MRSARRRRHWYDLSRPSRMQRTVRQLLATCVSGAREHAVAVAGTCLPSMRAPESSLANRIGVVWSYITATTVNNLDTSRVALRRVDAHRRLVCRRDRVAYSSLLLSSGRVWLRLTFSRAPLYADVADVRRASRRGDADRCAESRYRGAFVEDIVHDAARVAAGPAYGRCVAEWIESLGKSGDAALARISTRQCCLRGMIRRSRTNSIGERWWAAVCW